MLGLRQVDLQVRLLVAVAVLALAACGSDGTDKGRASARVSSKENRSGQPWPRFSDPVSTFREGTSGLSFQYPREWMTGGAQPLPHDDAKVLEYMVAQNPGMQKMIETDPKAAARLTEVFPNLDRPPSEANIAAELTWLSSKDLRRHCGPGDDYICMLTKPLEPGEVVVMWRRYGSPSSTPHGEEEVLKRLRGRKVDGYPAKVEVDRAAGHSRVGADVTIKALISLDPQGRQTLLMAAFLRGPDLEKSEQQVMAMLGSVKIGEQ